MKRPQVRTDPRRPSGTALGVTLAVVKNADDPQGQGRIEVEFKLDGAANADTSKPVFVPMMSPFAGTGRGAFFLPQQGDLALVAFADGDPSRPYVLGFLWNGVLKPPVEQAKQMDVRTIKTKKGKVVTFDDSDSGKLVISDEKQNRITLDTANNAVAIESQGDLKVTAKGTITLTGAQVVIENTGGAVKTTLGDAGIALQGGGSIKLTADMIDLN